MPVVLMLLMIAAYIGVPVILVWGWLRWLRRPRERNPFAALSLAGFVFASASALLAVGGVLYSGAIGGFPFYDPRLMRIYGYGLLLSLGAFVLSIPGMWRQNLLRWHAPGLSFGMLLLWVLWASGE
ncbi:MAG: hypothetical protein LAP21_00785 [Acidobacteriia bacterium]|nr:hypothetical protein [Terriglobia bacterium]